MKKNIFTIITIIILLLILAFFYQFINEENNNDGGDFCIEVLTDARNPETGEIKHLILLVMCLRAGKL